MFRDKKLEKPDIFSISKSKVSPIAVLSIDGRFELFFTENGFSPMPKIYRCASSDMINWSTPTLIYQSPILSKISGGVAFRRNGKICLVYKEEFLLKQRFVLLFSKDGINYRKEIAPIFDLPYFYGIKNPIGTPRITYNQSVYYLYFGNPKTEHSTQISMFGSSNITDWEPIGALTLPTDCYKDYDYINISSVETSNILLLNCIDNNGYSRTVYMLADVSLDKLLLEPKSNVFEIEHLYYPRLVYLANGHNVLVGNISTVDNKDSGLLSIPREMFIQNNKVHFRPIHTIEDECMDYVDTTIEASNSTENISIFDAKGYANIIISQLDNFDSNLILTLKNDLDSIKIVYNKTNGEAVITLNKTKKDTVITKVYPLIMSDNNNCRNDIQIILAGNKVDFYFGDGENTLTKAIDACFNSLSIEADNQININCKIYNIRRE